MRLWGKRKTVALSNNMKEVFWKTKAKCSLVLPPLPQSGMTGAQHLWGLACGGSCLFVPANGHAVEKRRFAISHWPGLKEKLLLPWKILSTQSLWEAESNNLFKHKILLTSPAYCREVPAIFLLTLVWIIVQMDPLSFTGVCVWVMFSKLQHYWVK